MMCPTSADFFRVFFAELERRGIAAVVLHSYDTFPEIIESDVDYAVSEADFGRLEAIEIEIASAHGWLVVQQLQHQICARYTVFVSRENPRHTLKLDVSSHYVKDHCLFLGDKFLLAGRRPAHGFHVPAPAVEFAYVLAKTFAKNKPPSKVLTRLCALHAIAPASADEAFRMLCGSEAGSFKDWIDRPEADWELLNRKVRKRHRYGTKLWLRELRRILTRARNPTGFVLVMLGPDGAGKSTAIQHVREWMEPCFRRQLAFHFRPKTFEAKSVAPQTNPHASPPRNSLASMLKIIYYLADTWLGWLLKIWKARRRSTLVIFDRDLLDMVADPRRYRLRDGWFLRFAAALRPRADLTVVLDAPPEIIHARKPELTVNELGRQRQLRIALASADSTQLLINADALPAQVTLDIVHAVVTALARRLDPDIPL